MKIISVVSTILLLKAHLHVGECIEFNRNLTTLFFSPYVKKAEGGMPIPDRDTYVFDDLFPMLELVSTKFSKLATGSAGVKDAVKYIRNLTYYHDTYVLGRTPEAVATFNRKTSSKNLTLLIGLALRPWKLTQGEETQVMVGIEAAEIANEIYPGTVEGFVFTNYDDKSFEWANVTLHWLRFIRRVAPSLKVGIFQECIGIAPIKPTDEVGNSNRLIDRQIDLIKESDFIGCDIVYESEETILKFRSVIHEINKNIEVITDISRPSDGNPHFFSLEKMVQRWSEANAFAIKYTYPCWLNEAFDNPWRSIKHNPPAAFTGWWKLKSNDLIRNRSGYLEKNSELIQPEMLNDTKSVNEENSKTWIYAVSLVLIAGIGSVGIGWKLLLNKYKRKMSELLLTKQEIDEFINGAPEMQVSQNEICNLVSPSAFREPYETSLEIDKGRLEIFEDVILGFGEFGCVYKAVITNEEEKQEVALKTTKEDCPSTALKNLLSEIKILAYLGQHKNIVSICGAYTAELESGILYVALELCTGGSLKGHLKALRSTSKTYNAIQAIKDDMYRWSYEICCGMEYLGQKNVIHADLATRNILLTQNGTAKITDFGLSRRLYEYANYIKKQQEPLPWRWMALESLKLMAFSTKSDVWSYGVTLWEIFSLGSQPYSGLLWTSEFVESLEKGMRMKQPEYSTGELYQTMLRCWAPDPKTRPGFSDLRELVRSLDTDVEYANTIKCGKYKNVSLPGQKV